MTTRPKLATVVDGAVAEYVRVAQHLLGAGNLTPDTLKNIIELAGTVGALAWLERGREVYLDAKTLAEVRP